jgi:hypothetical protein
MRHPMPPNPLRTVKSNPDLALKNIATLGVAGRLDERRRRKEIYGKETIEWVELLKEDPPFPVGDEELKSPVKKGRRGKNVKVIITSYKY